MQENITIKKATKEDFLKLKELNYENSLNHMFALESNNNSITLKEIEIEKPIVNINEYYTEEIDDFASELEDEDTVAYIVFCDDNPAGYVFARREKRKTGNVVCIDGILTANEYRKKGLARKLTEHLIEEARKDESCQGVAVEMDTQKYAAIKLFLKTGFQFSGTELFVFSNEGPSDGSKEVVYLYYKID